MSRRVQGSAYDNPGQRRLGLHYNKTHGFEKYKTPLSISVLS